MGISRIDRRLGERQVEVEVQHHHGPLVDRQAAQLSLETIAFRQPHRHVPGLRRFLVGRHVQLDQVPTPFLACHAIARPHGQPVEPGVPCIRVTDGSHVSPGRDERFLDRVLSTVPIAQDEGGDGIQSTDRRSRQDGERVVVAQDRPFHELSLHATTGSVRRIRPHSYLWARQRETVPWVARARIVRAGGSGHPCIGGAGGTGHRGPADRSAQDVPVSRLPTGMADRARGSVAVRAAQEPGVHI